MARFKPFDISAHLDDDAVIAEFLTAALEDPAPEAFLSAVGKAAKARGTGAVAERAGLPRASLDKALASGAKPRLDTILKVLQGIGMKLSVTAA